MPAELRPLLSLCVFAMMLCIGLDFSWRTWRGLLAAPRPLWVGLVAQNAVMPALGFCVAWMFRDVPDVALGMVLVVAAPGGPVANAIVHFAGARIDISVSLTALNGVLSLLTVPLVANLGFTMLSGSGVSLGLPVGPTLTHIATIILLPIGLGMALRRLWRGPALVLGRVARLGTMVMLLAILVMVFSASARRIGAHMAEVLPAALLLCAAMLGGSLVFSRLCGLDRSTRFAIANEVSVHNVPLALLFADSVLNRPELAGIIVVYAPVIFAMTMGWALAFRRREAIRSAHP